MRFILILAGLLFFSVSAQAGDAAAGEKVFKKCKS
ncbi:MAG: cytochrome c family protein, partial [Proteobacteria bacterium]|nr:cytochrome c family protein [Pseudomonadota bacterium]